MNFPSPRQWIYGVLKVAGKNIYRDRKVSTRRPNLPERGYRGQEQCPQEILEAVSKHYNTIQGVVRSFKLCSATISCNLWFRQFRYSLPVWFCQWSAGWESPHPPAPCPSQRNSLRPLSFTLRSSSPLCSTSLAPAPQHWACGMANCCPVPPALTVSTARPATPPTELPRSHLTLPQRHPSANSSA